MVRWLAWLALMLCGTLVCSLWRSRSCQLSRIGNQSVRYDRFLDEFNPPLSISDQWCSRGRLPAPACPTRRSCSTSASGRRTRGSPRQSIDLQIIGTMSISVFDSCAMYDRLYFFSGLTLTSLKIGHQVHFAVNQLEKLEAAKAAWLVCLSLLSLIGSFLVRSFWFNFYWPYLALLSLT